MFHGVEMRSMDFGKKGILIEIGEEGDGEENGLLCGRSPTAFPVTATSRFSFLVDVEGCFLEGEEGIAVIDLVDQRIGKLSSFPGSFNMLAPPSWFTANQLLCSNF
ncbi:hypothetical protein V6N13_111764 [Hibiscus sabdariffa]|uniref:Uncharacterized protein n=1 Tax=Hibiscus sabdariffa TaxID=183260 RepID=A0ABR2TL93_9ROSI